MSDTQEFSLNDLDNVEEQELEGFDPETEYFSAPPPVDDDTYSVMIKQQDGKPIQGKTDKNGNSYYTLSLEARIVSGKLTASKFADRPLFDNPTTIILRGSTKVAGILQALGTRPASSGAGQIKQLALALQANPVATVRTRWEAQYKNAEGKYENVVKAGQRNFPQDSKGNYQHIVEAPDGNDVVAQARIIAYIPLKK